MDPDKVKDYFCRNGVVCDYARAVFQVGLWESERMVFQKFFKPESSILELGCGAGRISYGLFCLGFKDLTATDFSPAMIEVAKNIFDDLGGIVKCRLEDATSLSFGDACFDGAIFGFNGLMQIPLRERRRNAMSEIFRVLKAGSHFAFTTHDRNNPKNTAYWQTEERIWREFGQSESLDEFGDICYKSEHGEIFIHSPTSEEIEDDMAGVGFQKVFEKKRGEIAFEPQAVKEFSDECIFRVYLKK